MSNVPWYRHVWPWILMSGPAIVVVAGLWTWVLAARIAAADGLVSDEVPRPAAVHAPAGAAREAAP